jgi:hypothetical protein
VSRGAVLIGDTIHAVNGELVEEGEMVTMIKRRGAA